MTPAQLEHLRLLKAHLESLLATAEKRTPGEWENDTGSVLAWCLKDTPNSRRHIDGGFYLIVAESDNDATFIASCAGNAEAGWKSTLKAIDDWLSLYNSTEGYADGAPDASTHDRLCNEVSSICRINLGHILAEWPIETLR